MNPGVVVRVVLPVVTPGVGLCGSTTPGVVVVLREVVVVGVVVDVVVVVVEVLEPANNDEHLRVSGNLTAPAVQYFEHIHKQDPNDAGNGLAVSPECRSQ